MCRRHPPLPNNSFKPTPHRGINSALYATLHAVAAPLWVGLTQALGGRKAFGCFAFQCSFFRLRLALLFGRFPAALLLRSSPSGALTHRRRCVLRLRKHWLVRIVFRDRHGRFGYTRLKAHRCASGLSRCVFRQVRRGSVRIGIHRHLTIRSSRPHVVASAVCFTLRLHTSAAPPRVGLTQALGAKEKSANDRN